MTETKPNLNDWLAKLYRDDIKKNKTAGIADFRIAILGDAELGHQALARRDELNAMIKARGERACAFSTKYRDYLQEALT